MDLRTILDNLVNIGFFSVVLPFLLIYVIVFSILEKSNLFSGGSSDSQNVKSTNAIIAFVFALFVVASLQTVRIIQNLITQISIFIVFILVVLILLGFLFGDNYKELFIESGHLTKLSKILASIIATVVLIVFLNIIGVIDWIYNYFGNGNFSDFLSNSTISTIVVLILLGLIMYFISKGNNNAENKNS